MSIRINSCDNRININRYNTVFKRNPVTTDKVEISAKKKELSTGAKVGISAASVAIIGLGIYNRKSLKKAWDSVIGNKPVNEKYVNKIDNIKENFSSVFRRDFTKDEANELALKYKKIFEIKDNGEFMGKLFEQICRDYKLPETPWTLEKLKNKDNFGQFSLNNGMAYNSDLLEYYFKDGVAHFTKIDRKSLINAMAHELKHAEQHKIAMGVDFEKSIYAEVDNKQKLNKSDWRELLAESNNNIETARQVAFRELSDAVLPSYRNVEKISSDSPLYQKGLELIESFRNRVESEADYSAYRNTLHEKEAFDAGDRFEEIFEWVTK